MKTSFELVAEFREDQGKGASRRLRRLGKVPAILYGGRNDARSLQLDHQKLLGLMDNERFYSTILSLRVGDETQAAVLKDVQRHPYRNQVMHIDFQRVLEDEKIRMIIPLHFTGAAEAPGVKTAGGILSHVRNEIEVLCLPKDLPEYIEVDCSALELNEAIHVADLRMPAGVEAAEVSAGRNPTVVTVHAPRVEEEPTPVVDEAAAAAAAAAPGEAGAAAPAGEAKPAGKEGAAPAAEAKPAGKEGAAKKGEGKK